LKDFEEVANCKTIEELNQFIQEYLVKEILKVKLEEKRIGLCSIVGKSHPE